MFFFIINFFIYSIYNVQISSNLNKIHSRPYFLPPAIYYFMFYFSLQQSS